MERGARAEPLRGACALSPLVVDLSGRQRKAYLLALLAFRPRSTVLLGRLRRFYSRAGLPNGGKKESEFTRNDANNAKYSVDSAASADVLGS